MMHTCHAEGCAVLVAPKMFACLRHWRMVPRWLQACLWAAYRPGQEVDKRVTGLYHLVQTRCRLAIAEHEGRPEVDALRRQIGELCRAGLSEGAEHKHSPDDVQLAGIDAALKRRFGGSP